MATAERELEWLQGAAAELEATVLINDDLERARRELFEVVAALHPRTAPRLVEHLHNLNARPWSKPATTAPL